MEQGIELDLFDKDGRSLAVHTAQAAAVERATLTIGPVAPVEKR